MVILLRRLTSLYTAQWHMTIPIAVLRPVALLGGCRTLHLSALIIAWSVLLATDRSATYVQADIGVYTSANALGAAVLSQLGSNASAIVSPPGVQLALAAALAGAVDQSESFRHGPS